MKNLILWEELEKIASRKVNGKSLKEIFSYKGVSFWWRLKNMVIERRVVELTSSNFFFNCTLRYYTELQKDRLFGKIFKGTGKRNPKIVVFSLLRNFNKYFKEIEDELRNRDADFSILCSLPQFPKFKELKNLNGYTLQGFLNEGILEEEQVVRKRFMELIPLLSNELEQLGVEKEKSVLYARYFIEKEIPEAFRLGRMVEETIKAIKPSVMFLTQEVGKHSYPAIIAARKHGVISVSMGHGSGIKNGYDIFHLKENMSKSSRDSINFVQPDFYLSYGDLDKRQFLETGNYSKERIIPSGQPRNDTMIKFVEKLDKKSIREKYDIAQDKNMLLWATQTHIVLATAEDNEAKAAIAYSAIKELPRWQLVVKLHPSEDSRGPLYARYNKKITHAKIFYSRDQRVTWELICAADAVMTSVSTVGTEAIIIGRPLLLLDPFRKYDLTYYTDIGIDTIIRKEGDMVKCLNNITNGKYNREFKMIRRRFLKEAYANLGHSAEKIADFLELIAKRKK